MLSRDATAQQMGECWEMKSGGLGAVAGDRALKGQSGRVQESSPAPIFGLWGVVGGGGC